ncbi:YdeI/OmpD-associated family protein [Arachidicoccus ginsenosidimutans]|uniref:YdeI/OmpD-associated family protein n=1 Tax=Arachidicoccus sp. BS20 TaxID=1850526 RepID=UPI0018D381FD|nr:YdeI/OmpD-associated family protein [Arachidicoccus sp. BS20]
MTNKASEDTGGMGILGKITSLENLPSDEKIIQLIQQAMTLTEEGKTIQRKPATKNLAIEVPKDFGTALKKNKNAFTNFKNFSPSKKKEYIEWITEAKTEATRTKRIETSVERIAEGKARNWKYEMSHKNFTYPKQ